MAVGIVASLLWGPAQAADPASQALAQEVPAFQAPADPASQSPYEAAEPEGPLTLPDALALALMGNPELASFSWEARAAEARALQAGKVVNPEIAYRYYRLNAESSDPADEEDSRNRLILSQVFELGGKRRRRVDLAQAEHDVVGWDYEAKRVEVAAAVVTHFVAVAGAERAVAVWREHVAFLEALRSRATVMVEIGTLRVVDLHDLKRRLGLSRIELRRVENELSAARLMLAATWGSRNPRFAFVVGDLEDVRPTPPLESVAALLPLRPAVARFDAEKRLGQATLAEAKSARVPDLEAGLGVRWGDQADTRDYLMDFRIGIPLFDRKQGDILEARHGLEKIEAQRRAAETLGATEIARFHDLLAESDAKRAILKDEVLPAARAAFEAHRQGLDSLTGGVDDILDAQRDLTDAEVAYVEALVEYHQALAGLEGVLGQDLDRLR